MLRELFYFSESWFWTKVRMLVVFFGYRGWKHPIRYYKFMQLERTIEGL
jgi:hypothetical protein